MGTTRTTLQTGSPSTENKNVYGVIAEFDQPEHLVEAGRRVHHEFGFKKLDALTPFPIHGIDDAIGVPRSILGYIVFGCGVFGLANAILMAWYTSAVDYPLVIGGKPLFAWEFSIPPMFELTILLSAFGAVFGMLALNKLPQFYHPTFNYSNFAKVTDDKFLLVIEASDPLFDVKKTPDLLRSLGATRTEVVEA